MSEQQTDLVIEHVLDPNGYQPTIVGQLDELVARLEKLQPQLPKTTEIFLKVLKTHRNKHPYFEDWLIIPMYGFFWNGDSSDRDLKRLKWIEDRLAELANALSEKEWRAWIEEIMQQTNCLTTHRIADRIYDYLLHMYGALYLIRQGWNIQFLPAQKGGPDIVGQRWEEQCVMECKFKHISKKFESLFWRFDTACSRYIRKPLVVSAQFRFPDSEGFQELSQKHCLLLKEFISQVYQDTEVSHRGRFGDMIFEYDPSLLPATDIKSYTNCARSSAEAFFQGSLSAVVDRAAKQIGDSKYTGHQQFLFLGIQPDPLLSMPWTDKQLREIELLLALKAYWKYEISVIFSEEVGFSVAGYL